jgi:hypothetical protein
VTKSSRPERRARDPYPPAQRRQRVGHGRGGEEAGTEDAVPQDDDRGQGRFAPQDPVNNEVVNALQRILEQTEDDIQQDRKNIDQALSTAQENFLRNAPAVEKLPGEQKQLAEAIEKGSRP